ncbi:MAG: hypothetical protein ACK518_01520 [bacterium]|jgi:hypothetical protein
MLLLDLGQTKLQIILENTKMSDIKSSTEENGLEMIENQKYTMTSYFLQNIKHLLTMKLPKKLKYKDKEKYYEEAIE